MPDVLLEIAHSPAPMVLGLIITALALSFFRHTWVHGRGRALLDAGSDWTMQHAFHRAASAPEQPLLSVAHLKNLAAALGVALNLIVCTGLFGFGRANIP